MRRRGSDAQSDRNSMDSTSVIEGSDERTDSDSESESDSGSGGRDNTTV